MSEWRKEREATSRGQFVLGSDGIEETDEFIWREYSLFLLVNRHVADSIDDNDVSTALQQMRAKVPVPFETI